MQLQTSPERTAFAASLPRGLTIDRVWAIAVVLVAVIVGLFARLHTTDLAYHLRAGAQILDAHRVPSVDTFTFTVAGGPWLDQQWGAQALMTIVFRAGGWRGLAMFHALLVGATFWFLWLACRARGCSPRTSSILTFAGFLVSFLNTGMRPQTVALPLFTASLWILAGRRDHPKRLWLLVPLAAFWSNLHGSFVLAPVLVGLAWIEDRHRRDPLANRTLLIGSCALAATLANPFGPGAWRYAIGITTNARIVQQVQEWQATSVRSAAGVLFFISGLAVAAHLARRSGRVHRITLLWLGAFFLLGLPALRNVIWWGLVFPVAISGLVPEVPDDEEADRRGNPVLNLALAAALVAIVAVELPWMRDRPDPASGASSLLTLAPEHLVEAVRASEPGGARLFVSQPLASWFELALPDRPVFVDSRIEIFPDRVWTDYLAVMAGRDGWRSTLDRWRVDAVVLQKEDTVLGSLIARDPGWRLAYRDAMGSVYVRA